MKILIIEDDTGLNRGLEFALSQDGYEIVTADSAKEGLRLFKVENPDGMIFPARMRKICIIKS